MVDLSAPQPPPTKKRGTGGVKRSYEQAQPPAQPAEPQQPWLVPPPPLAPLPEDAASRHQRAKKARPADYLFGSDDEEAVLANAPARRSGGARRPSGPRPQRRAAPAGGAASHPARPRSRPSPAVLQTSWPAGPAPGDETDAEEEGGACVRLRPSPPPPPLPTPVVPGPGFWEPLDGAEPSSGGSGDADDDALFATAMDEYGLLQEGQVGQQAPPLAPTGAGLALAGQAPQGRPRALDGEARWRKRPRFHGEDGEEAHGFGGPPPLPAGVLMDGLADDFPFSLDPPGVVLSFLPADVAGRAAAGGARKKGSLPPLPPQPLSAFIPTEPYGRPGSASAKPKSKQHNPWSHAESFALVEGVSLCGGGKWAEIKKLGFPEIAVRTAVDLKDKWCVPRCAGELCAVTVTDSPRSASAGET